ncbi:MAG: hypothetical protein ABSF62_02315 [Bryobacteraceae bacterium]
MTRCLLFLLPLACWGQSCTYYVATAGSDSANGTSSSTPYRTIAKAVNAATLSPGNTVCLNKGDKWREQMTPAQSGTSGNAITFTSYGTGAKPQILGSIDLSSTSAWTETTGPTGAVTQANMRLSTVNGTAFVDFGAAGELTPYTGQLLTITDSASNTITGYIKAAGTGETYGSQLLANTAFSNTTGVSAGSGATIASVAGGQSGNALRVTSSDTSGWDQAYESIATAVGYLLKASTYMEKGTDSQAVFQLQQAATPWGNYNGAGTTTASWSSNYTVYATMSQTGLNVIFAACCTATSGLTNLYDTASVTQVLTPSTTGVTITSTSGGTTYNWASQGGSFNPNDANGYTYSIAAGGATNLWYATSTLDVGSLIFNTEASVGVKESTQGAAVAQGEFYWDTVSRVYLYSSSNPGSFYSHIEAAQKQFGALIASLNYITIDGLDFRYQGLNGVEISSSPTYVTPEDHVTVKNSNFAYIGGAYAAGTTRLGNAVEVYSGATNITVTNNTFNQIYDTAFTHQGGILGSDSGDSQANEVYGPDLFAYNVVQNSEMCWEFFVYGTSPTATGIRVLNNTCYNDGSGWSHSQRPDPEGTGFMSWGSTVGTVSGCAFENNIVYGSSNWLFTAWGTLAASLGGWTVDYNDYYPDSSTAFCESCGGTTPVGNFASWQAYSSQDAHSFVGDPKFASPSGGAFTLQSTSPASGTGLYIAGVTSATPNVGALGTLAPPLIRGVRIKGSKIQ